MVWPSTTFHQPHHPTPTSLFLQQPVRLLHVLLGNLACNKRLNALHLGGNESLRKGDDGDGTGGDRGSTAAQEATASCVKLSAQASCGAWSGAAQAMRSGSVCEARPRTPQQAAVLSTAQCEATRLLLASLSVKAAAAACASVETLWPRMSVKSEGLWLVSWHDECGERGVRVAAEQRRQTSAR